MTVVRTDRRIGLYQIATEAQKLDLQQLQKMIEAAGGQLALQHSGALDRMKAWLDRIEKTVAEIRSCAPGKHSDGVIEFAERCARAATQVRLFLGNRPPDAEAAAAYMEAAATLMDECNSLQATEAWERAVIGTSSTATRSIA